MEYSFLVSPLAVVAGIQDPRGDVADSDHNGSKTPLSIKQIALCDGFIKNTATARIVSQRLVDLSKPPGPWNARLSREDRINFMFSNSVQVTRRSIKPSPISPRSPDCGSPVFTNEWVRKYLYFQPAVAVLFLESPKGEEREDALIEALIAQKEALAHYQVQVVVALVGDRDVIMSQAPYIRKQVGMPASSMLPLANNADDQESTTFADSLYQESLAISQEFFANKMRALRTKRKAVAPPLDLFLWDTRYTLKLAYCSEFKGDLAGAIKLYESAYDSLALLFENKAIVVTSPSYENARQVLDAVAVKIFQHSLPSKMAFDKLNIHIATVEHMWGVNGIDKAGPNALTWKAMQHALFAHLCMSVKQAGMATTGLSQHPAGTPTGLIWLDAASLFATEPNSEVKDDPYSSPIVDSDEVESLVPTHDPQGAFLNAISELSGYKRAKAYALSQYGTWLSRSDPEAASQAFKSSQQMLSPNIWPEVQKFLSAKLNDRLMLFTLGELDEMPSLSHEDSSRVPTLFECTGTFERPETHIGREIRAQVRVNPLFPGKLKLDKLRITHGLGSITFVHSESDSEGAPKALTVADLDENSEHRHANLRFDKGQSQTFQFALTPLETGELELFEVEFFSGDNFVQRNQIGEGNGAWLTSADSTAPQTVKHLPIAETSLVVNVTTRPAKLDVNDLTPLIAAVGEKLRFNFELRSHEDHDIKPKLSIELSAKNGSETRTLNIAEDHRPELIQAGGSYVSIQGDFDVPSTAFDITLSVQFDTQTDTLPVKFEYKKDIDVVKPFRVGFDLTPEYLEQEWPAVFAPSLELPRISRKWCLNATVLSLFTGEDTILHSSSIRVESELAEISAENPTVELTQTMHHNSLKALSHTFLSRPKNPDLGHPIRKFEAAAYVELVWSRRSLGIKNKFVLPPVRLNLPTQEPRVLAVANKLGGSLATSQVTFHIENPSPRLLNFSISMASSTFFAFQGPKAVTIRMLPFSTRALTYQLTPLGDGAVQNKRPLPDLRVYDINYKRALAVLPGDKTIRYEQGSLFI